MSQKALGMVETMGILAAYEAADVALKSANVKMVGYEISRGGLVVVKFTGDVSAVRSAVDAAKTAASKLSKVWSSHVIARPAAEIENMINSEDTVNSKNPVNNKDKKIKEEKTAEDNNPENDFKEDNETNQIDSTKAEKDEEVNIVEAEQEEVKDDLSEFETDQDNNSTAELEAEEIEEAEEEEKQEEDICNLCGDPACPRSKGDLHKDCIHYDEIKDDE